eukprot:CAMPEP_0172768208 /NCGR_PEP_ID=MMETSP1074-20121228/184324_1 /TAXON_ID=2916 /ORGANISM="Ceratium fusus, Strain PA161109" /LENGTH=93 /DNA_ID=CAMNT_0013603573 /DNA_START=227 /DNA_END=508 /DNA_ORIENTATION=-
MLRVRADEERGPLRSPHGNKQLSPAMGTEIGSVLPVCEAAVATFPTHVFTRFEIARLQEASVFARKSIGVLMPLPLRLGVKQDASGPHNLSRP